MKNKINSIDSIYGAYASEHFVQGMLNLAKEAKLRIRTNLDYLLKSNADNYHINTCVEAEQFWKLIEEECKQWLKD